MGNHIIFTIKKKMYNLYGEMERTNYFEKWEQIEYWGITYKKNVIIPFKMSTF